MHGQFESARSLASSIDAYCADSNPLPPCGGVALQRNRLESLRTLVQADFDATTTAYREASIDVPPGRRLIQSLVRN